MKSANFKHLGKEHTFRTVSDEDCIFSTLKRGFFYEGHLLETIRSLNLKGTYIDVGANIGNHSVYFSEHCPSNKVISIEISPVIGAVLQDNLLLNCNKDVEYYNVGLSDKQGFVTLSEIPGDNVGMTKIVDYSDGKAFVDTMDNLFGHLKDISLIKIDVEGAEIRVLKGMTKVLENNNPVIFVELQTKPLLEEFIVLISPFGYSTDRKNYAATPTYMFKR